MMQNQVYEPPHEPELAPTGPPRLNLMFPRSIHGMLKIAQILLTFILFICIASAGYIVSTTGWLNFVAATTFVLSVLFFLFYFFHLITQLPGPWVIIEFSVLTISAFLFFLNMIIAGASWSSNDSGRIATAIFSTFTGVAYAVECALRFRVFKENGQFVISSTNVNTTRRDVRGDAEIPSVIGSVQPAKTGSLRPDYVGQDEYVMP